MIGSRGESIEIKLAKLGRRIWKFIKTLIVAFVLALLIMFSVAQALQARGIRHRPLNLSHAITLASRNGPVHVTMDLHGIENATQQAIHFCLAGSS